MHARTCFTRRVLLGRRGGWNAPSPVAAEPRCTLAPMATGGTWPDGVRREGDEVWVPDVDDPTLGSRQLSGSPATRRMRCGSRTRAPSVAATGETSVGW